jgi:hypothetical protein
MVVHDCSAQYPAARPPGLGLVAAYEIATRVERPAGPPYSTGKSLEYSLDYGPLYC